MKTAIVIIAIIAAILGAVGCDRDSAVRNDETVVLNPERSYFEGLVQISERIVETRGQFGNTIILQGTITNFGPDLKDAHLDMRAANVATRLDGTIEYLDERVVATVPLGILHRNRSLSVNLSWTHASMTPLRITSQFYPSSAN